MWVPSSARAPLDRRSRVRHARAVSSGDQVRPERRHQHRLQGGRRAGRRDLIFIQGNITNLDIYWDDRRYREFCERLASFSRLILFDKRGMGLSDRVETGTMEDRMDDVRAVLDAVGSERAVVMGASEGGLLATLFAAAHPERTESLVLLGSEVREERDEGWPWGEFTRAEFEAADGRLVALGRGRRRRQARPEPGRCRRRGGPRVVGPAPAQRRQPALDRGVPAASFGTDTRAILPIDPRADARRPSRATIGPSTSATAATWPSTSRAPGTSSCPGSTTSRGSTPDEILGEIQEFVTGTRPLVEVDRVLATVLFTDVVGSTARAAEIGDGRWGELLGRPPRGHPPRARALPGRGGRHGR